MFEDRYKMNFEEIMQRVASIMEIESGNAPYDKQIAYELGLSPTQYANDKKRNTIPYKEIVIFCDKHGITINWVLLGKSSMHLIEKEEDIYKIRLIDNINASCGGGGYFDEEICSKYIYLDKESANKLGIFKAENFDAISVVGDSMLPTIKEDSILFVDTTKNSLIGSGIYVLNSTTGLFVKRVHLNPNGNIELLSDNKSYPMITMLAEEINIVGKVVGALDQFKNLEGVNTHG